MASGGKRNNAGRKRLSEKEKRNVTVSFKLTVEEKKQLDEARKNLSVPDFIMKLLEKR